MLHPSSESRFSSPSGSQNTFTTLKVRRPARGLRTIGTEGSCTKSSRRCSSFLHASCSSSMKKTLPSGVRAFLTASQKAIEHGRWHVREPVREEDHVVLLGRFPGEDVCHHVSDLVIVLKPLSGEFMRLRSGIEGRHACGVLDEMARSGTCSACDLQDISARREAMKGVLDLLPIRREGGHRRELESRRIPVPADGSTRSAHEIKASSFMAGRKLALQPGEY
jgi:hypothetical protein